MKGHCDFFQSPRGFPYIPGGDICGIVEECDDYNQDSTKTRTTTKRKFRKGDVVLGMFQLPRPLDGLAEYICVPESHVVELAPKQTNPMEAACLTSSALTAYHAAKGFVKPNDRVLVLGASGGVGPFLVQLAKLVQGASFVCATTKDATLLNSLTSRDDTGATTGPVIVDRVIDYTMQNWWDVKEFQEQPFDVIIDLAVGLEGWKQSRKVLKSGWRGGTYVAVTSDEPLMEIHSWSDTFKFMMKLQGRMLWTHLWRFGRPKYFWLSGLDIKPGAFSELVELVETKRLKIVLDPASSSDFTIDAVKNAFKVMEGRRAHGKVVIHISSMK